MWQQRQWRELLLLIDWLPRNSAYMEALSEDEEVAEDFLSQAENKKAKGARPRISEWSPELERLTDTVDRLGEVMQAVVASNGGKPPRIRPQLRPKTAIDKVRERKRHEHHKKVVSRVLIQQPDGSLAPVQIGKPKHTKKASPASAATPQRPVILPGEDPFRLKAPRRRAAAPEGGAVTGEPKGPATGDPKPTS
jgi:hypothetical protein